MSSTNIHSGHTLRIYLVIMALITVLISVYYGAGAGAYFVYLDNNSSSEAGTTYTTDVPFANEPNINNNLEKVPNITDKLSGKNPKIPHISSGIAVINGTAKREGKKSKSEIIFPSGYKIDRSGIEDVGTIPSVNVQNKRSGIVQFYEPLTLSTVDELRIHGINLYESVDSGSLSYYANFPVNEITYLENSGIVKWLGLIPKNGKIDNNIFNYILQNPDETVKNYIIVFPDIDETFMRTKIQEFVDIVDYSPEGHFYLVSSKRTKLQQILDLEFVKQIEEWKPSVTTNVQGLPAVGGDTVLGLGSYNGSGVTIELTDTGIAYAGGNYHPDLPVPSDQWDYGSGDSIADDQNSHGTHTAGTALGRGNRNSLYTGVAPGASLISYKWVGVSSAPFANVMTRAAQYSTDVSSNSWAYVSSNGNYYTSGSGVVDTAVLGQYNNKKISVIVAAGNDNNFVADPGSNKNGITVGAATAGNDDNRQYSWSSGCTDDAEPAATNACFSNYGPISGRLKPDVMAPGYMIISSYPWYLGGCNVNGDNYYCKYSGTSMAAPNVAGIAAVMMQSQPILKNWPEGVKARIINSAIYINSVPQIRQGHGHVSEFYAVYDQPGIFERPLLSLDNISGPRGSFKEYTFNVPQGFKEVKVTLVYSDNAGSATTQDIDLYVYNESGAQVGSSLSGTDTVEELKFTSGTPGTWKARAQIYSTTRTVNYSVVASVRRQDPALSLSDLASTSVQPGSSFSLTTTLGNNGYATVGSYIAMQQPSGFTLNDVDVYRNDGKIGQCP